MEDMKKEGEEGSSGDWPPITAGEYFFDDKHLERVEELDEDSCKRIERAIEESKRFQHDAEDLLKRIDQGLAIHVDSRPREEIQGLFRGLQNECAQIEARLYNELSATMEEGTRLASQAMSAQPRIRSRAAQLMIRNSVKTREAADRVQALCLGANMIPTEGGLMGGIKWQMFKWTAKQGK